MDFRGGVRFDTDPPRKALTPLRSRPQPDAAGRLISIDRLLERLEDSGAVPAPGTRTGGADLARGDLVVVVFGTGSSGKTSLIRALLQDMGDVAAAMGSTRSTPIIDCDSKDWNGVCAWWTHRGFLRRGTVD